MDGTQLKHKVVSEEGLTRIPLRIHCAATQDGIEEHTEADAIMVRAKREIGIARDTAVKDLYALSGQLATDLAGKILQKELDAASHDRLIQESINQIAKLETRN